MPSHDQEQLPVVVRNGSTEEYTLEISAKVWKLRTCGLSEFDIATELDLSVPVVRKILESYRKQYRKDSRKAVKEELELDLERCDELIKQFRPVALAGTVDVTRFDSKGESYTDKEWKYCLQAGQLVLSVMERRAKLLGYDKQDEDRQMIGDHNTLIWLNKENSVIERLVAEQPSETHQDPVVDVDFEEA